MANSKKKTAKQTRVLVASVVLAGLIVAGGTFAWFTSKDEVTNKLTASNNYGVSITESFDPPSQWVPGQEINKDVSVVNTGNVDSFVKVTISDAISGKVMDADGVDPDDIDDACIKLSTEDGKNEVIAIQAAGQLVQAPAGTKYKGEVVTAPMTFESSTPATNGDEGFDRVTGLYVFAYNTSDASTEYSGYYYDKDSNKYYALKSIEEGTTGVFTATIAKEVALDDSTDIKFADSVTTDENNKPYIMATYGSDDSAIKIRVYLADNYSENWTQGDTVSDTLVFYYKKILPAGTTSERLVEALVLDADVKNDAYTAFDYDLTIGMESVQVVLDEEGNASAESVTWEGVEAAVADDGVKVTWTKKAATTDTP